MNAKAQKDSVNYFTSDSIASLKEVVVSGIIPARAKETSWNITSLPQKNMRASGAYSIADALAKTPGISQLNTGVGISKPVIRGLYGNRILAVLSGMRFDNQQWQDEHGLGLNDMGIDRVEIIKGPAGLLYGSEAIGGALHIIEEQPAKPGTACGEVNTRFFTNTLGTFTDVGFKGATEKNNWRIRAGINSQADYTDGDGKRILNSRFSGYYIKGSFGFTKKNWTSINHYSGSIDQFGFITEDNLNSKKPDGRWSRSMDGPHHKVILNVLSSQNTIKLRQSVLKLNVGAQSNLRLENEGGNEISLKMLLSSAIYNLQWIKTISQHTQLILGNNFLYQNNTNYGKRIIVPDANTIEAGGAIYLKNKWNKIILESGVGFSLRSIQTKQTGNVNAPSSEIQPFNTTKPIVNASMGAVANLTKSLNLKLNASSGFRSGNLAELSSNGLHEGTLRYEIGDPDLKIEQNINTELGINWQSKYVLLSAAVFYNYFSNYIYLTPTGDIYLGFDIFRYKQYNAHLSGGEAAADIAMPFYDALHVVSNFSTVTGKLANGTYLPFIPANKWHNEIAWHYTKGKKIKDMQLFVSGDNYFAQTHPAEFETKTGAYFLLNAGISGSIETTRSHITWSVSANNLLNKTYYDHLSRFKDYGIYNIGRNVAVNISIPFSM